MKKSEVRQMKQIHEHSISRPKIVRVSDNNFLDHPKKLREAKCTTLMKEQTEIF
jgi:hypothetical protein